MNTRTMLLKQLHKELKDERKNPDRFLFLLNQLYDQDELASGEYRELLFDMLALNPTLTTAESLVDHTYMLADEIEDAEFGIMPKIRKSVLIRNIQKRLSQEDLSPAAMENGLLLMSGMYCAILRNAGWASGRNLMNPAGIRKLQSFFRNEQAKEILNLYLEQSLLPALRTIENPFEDASFMTLRSLYVNLMYMDFAAVSECGPLPLDVEPYRDLLCLDSRSLQMKEEDAEEEFDPMDFDLFFDEDVLDDKLEEMCEDYEDLLNDYAARNVQDFMESAAANSYSCDAGTSMENTKTRCDSIFQACFNSFPEGWREKNRKIFEETAVPVAAWFDSRQLHPDLTDWILLSASLEKTGSDYLVHLDPYFDKQKILEFFFSPYLVCRLHVPALQNLLNDMQRYFELNPPVSASTLEAIYDGIRPSDSEDLQTKWTLCHFAFHTNDPDTASDMKELILHRFPALIDEEKCWTVIRELDKEDPAFLEREETALHLAAYLLCACMLPELIPIQQLTRMTISYVVSGKESPEEFPERMDLLVEPGDHPDRKDEDNEYRTWIDDNDLPF